ncbi:hypothetical protein BaRGS_00004354, partial [Batillaria attramentaria]
MSARICNVAMGVSKLGVTNAELARVMVTSQTRYQQKGTFMRSKVPGKIAGCRIPRRRLLVNRLQEREEESSSI